MERVNPHIQLIKSAGTAFTVRYPPELQPIIKQNPDYREYEPPPEIIFQEIIGEMNGREIDPKINFSDYGLRRTHAAYLVINFSNLSGIEPSKEILEFADLAVCLIHKLEKENEETGLKIGIGQQFGLALDLAEGKVPCALLGLALASRQAARDCDGRIFEKAKVKDNSYRFTEARMKNWKQILKGLVFEGDKPPEDAVGNLYHLWMSAVAGYARESYGPENGNPGMVNHLKTKVSDLMYNLQAPLTDLRYFIIRDEGGTHNSADRVGYEIGRGIFAFLRENES